MKGDIPITRPRATQPLPPRLQTPLSWRLRTDQSSGGVYKQTVDKRMTMARRTNKLTILRSASDVCVLPPMNLMRLIFEMMSCLLEISFSWNSTWAESLQDVTNIVYASNYFYVILTWICRSKNDYASYTNIINNDVQFVHLMPNTNNDKPERTPVTNKHHLTLLYDVPQTASSRTHNM